MIDTYMCGEEDEEKEALTWNEIPTQGYATVAIACIHEHLTVY